MSEMSRLMTIKWLKWIQNMFPKDSEQYKALDYAISSLAIDDMNDMSRKEAIELLDNLIGMIEDNHGADYDTALHMAINSLKIDEAYQLEYEKSLHEVKAEDCISREYLRKSMIEYGWSHPDCTVTEYVESLPPAIPKNDKPSGEWIPVKDPVNELPTGKSLWVTRRGDRFLGVERFYYMKTTLDKLFAEDVIAYMDYVEPEPYEWWNEEQTDEP